MDDASGSAADREQRHADVQTLLGLVDRRSLTAEQFHSACALLYDGQGPEQALSALIAAVSQGRASMAALIDAVTVPRSSRGPRTASSSGSRTARRTRWSTCEAAARWRSC
jgi:hypothetical protein